VAETQLETDERATHHLLLLAFERKEPRICIRNQVDETFGPASRVCLKLVSRSVGGDIASNQKDVSGLR
jgi:hypothetical protein